MALIIIINVVKQTPKQTRPAFVAFPCFILWGPHLEEGRTEMLPIWTERETSLRRENRSVHGIVQGSSVVGYQRGKDRLGASVVP